jgi:hypothetical protein
LFPVVIDGRLEMVTWERKLEIMQEGSETESTNVPMKKRRKYMDEDSDDDEEEGEEKTCNCPSCRAREGAPEDFEKIRKEVAHLITPPPTGVSYVTAFIFSYPRQSHGTSSGTHYIYA